MGSVRCRSRGSMTSILWTQRTLLFRSPPHDFDLAIPRRVFGTGQMDGTTCTSNRTQWGEATAEKRGEKRLAEVTIKELLFFPCEELPVIMA